MRALRWVIWITAGFVLLACAAWLWLLHTTQGARLIVARAGAAAGLEVAHVDGAIASGLDLQDVRFASDSVEVTIAKLSAAADIDVMPLSIRIEQASAETVRVAIAARAAGGDPGPDAADVLASLVLPFPLYVDNLRVSDIEVANGDGARRIEEVGLIATWFEDIQVHRLAVSMAELDAEGEAAIGLANGNAITSDVSASLKPALTQLREPVSVRVQTDGDPAGAHVLATVDTFARIDGQVRWQDGLDAAAEITLLEFELADHVDDWPAGFPLDGILRATINETGIALRDSVLEIGDTGGRILVDAGMRREDGRVDGRLRWQKLRWPLPDEQVRVRSESADLQLGGTLDDWAAVGTIAVAVRDLPPGKFEIDGKGDRTGARGRVVDSEVLGGRVAGEFAYSWTDAQAWLARLNLTSVHLDWLLPDWPAVVSGRLDAEGTGKPFAMHAILDGVDGELRGERLRADGVVDIANGDVIVTDLRVAHGSSSALLDGALMTPAGLRFELRVNELATYLDSLAGEVAATGVVSLAEPGFLDAALDSPLLSIGDVAVASLAARVAASDEEQSVALTGTYRDTPMQLRLSGAFADWREPLQSRFEGQLGLLEIDLGDEHSMALSEPAAVAFETGEFAVENLCLEDRVGASLCADVRWRQGGDYGAEMTLRELPLDIVEHLTESPFLFDQRISGTFNWQHTFGAGPRGSGRLTLSPGTIAPIDEPDSTVATGEAVLDFEIEQGRLLRGDVILPFPGRGAVSGDFSVADVRLGAESGVAGNLDVDLSSIRTLSRLTRLVDNASGALRARVNLAGTVAEPVWTGDLSLSDGEFSYGPVGLDLTEVELTGTMDPDYRFDVAGAFRAGRGKGEIVSRADYSNADEPGLMFRISGDRLTVVNVPDVFVEADMDLDVFLDRETLEINGEVKVPNALVKPRNITASKISESEDVIIVAGELPDPPEEKQQRSDLEYRGELNVSLGDSVVVDLDVAKANVTGAVNFNWQGGAIPIANGRYLIDGNIEAFGQVLEISEGSVQFPKVPADEPFIRVMAEREIYGNTQVKRAGVLVDGPIRRPTVEPYTRPLTTEERALALLVTGSDFDFEQGVGAIDFGTYIAPRLFVSYGVGVFERENIISARFDLSRGFGIKASSGSKESGIDLNYRFEN